MSWTALQRTACTDAYADSTPNRATPQFSQHAALARTAAEPVSLWVIRQYQGTPDIHFSHTPALIVLGRDDGQRNVQGWHSDYPYHWGINVRGRVPELPGEVLLGVQRNVCVSEFTKERGATAFKLGSHALNHGPLSTASPGRFASTRAAFAGAAAGDVEALAAFPQALAADAQLRGEFGLGEAVLVVQDEAQEEALQAAGRRWQG